MLLPTSSNGKLSGKPDEMLGKQPCDELSSNSGGSSNTLSHFMSRKPGNQDTTRLLGLSTDFTFSHNIY